MSGIGRDPHRLTTEICVKISVVGVARVLSSQFFSKFHLSIRVVLKLESLEFLLYSISYRIVSDTHYDKVVWPR